MLEARQSKETSCYAYRSSAHDLPMPSLRVVKNRRTQK